MHQKERIIQLVERDKFCVGLRDDGILHVYFRDNTVLDIDIQNEYLDILEEHFPQPGKKIIYEAGKNCSLTKPARDNAISMEARVNSSASVVFVQNAVYRMIANFYYKFNRPKQEMYVTGKFSEAVEWLLSRNKQ